jgi:hypothetical protein
MKRYTSVCGVETRLDAFSRCDADSKPVVDTSEGKKCVHVAQVPDQFI